MSAEHVSRHSAFDSLQLEGSYLCHSLTWPKIVASLATYGLVIFAFNCMLTSHCIRVWVIVNTVNLEMIKFDARAE